MVFALNSRFTLLRTRMAKLKELKIKKKTNKKKITEKQQKIINNE